MLRWFCVCALFLPAALSADVALERGDVHEQRYELAAQQFVTVKVELYDIDTDANVVGPDGEEVARNTAEYDPHFAFITKAAGTYTVILRTLPESSRFGTAEITLLEARPATPRDERLVDAHRAMHEAGMLLRAGTVGDAARAVVPLERALATFRDLGECRREMWAAMALGVAHGSSHDFTKALQSMHAAVAMQRELGEHRALAGTLRNLGGMLPRAGQPGAEEVLEEGKALSRLLAFAVLEADTHNYLGLRRNEAGDHREAIEHYERALEVTRRVGNLFQEALFTQNVAVSLASLGDWRRALTHFERAIPLYRGVGAKRELANTLQNVAAAYVWLGEHRDALAQFKAALVLVREYGDRRLEMTNRMNSGIAHGELGELDEADAALHEALAIAESYEDLRGEALITRHLGRIDEKRGDLKRALARQERTLALNQIIGSRRGEAFALSTIGTLHRRLGHSAEALQYIGAAHALACELGDPGLDSATRLGLARVHAGNGDYGTAWRQLEAALHGVESLRVNVAGQHLRASYQLTLREYYELAVDVLMRLNEPALALEMNERARARGLLDLLAEAQVDVRQGGDPELLAREKKLRRTINDKAAALARAPKNDKLAREVDGLVAELRRVESLIRASSPRYASLTQPAPSTLREIQRSVLDEDTLLIEISLGSDRGYVWAVSTEDVVVRELPSRKTVEAAARAMYAALTERNTRIDGETPAARLKRLADAKESFAKNGARLYDILLARLPLRGKSRLLVVADGALQYVPFSAIPLRDGQPLITSFEVVHMPSVSALAALRRETHGRRAAERSVAVLADPAYANLPRLPLTRDEAHSIARVAHRADVRMGEAATRAAAMSGELRRYRYVHFATHGVVDGRNPELSGIVLSDGYLRLHDIYNLDLPAELVVLSACQTALGKEVAHEGLVGLTRGFMYAGAERVLASLWKIDDRATAELMRRLYERMLVEHMTPAAALRAVQMEMAASARWRDPYHWAAFVLQGEWRP